ncbi:3-keto-5-aminohexanoate cleavage protein [Phyllobacterium chamaecytisi]|uniref:3-keto-5-aminohexanoate cleavage protein n=1 Tax=Phyllobacterium chamaecytisi TaxID=2876082 RepID=UPI001CD00503|nr:3-keto-5-aminohexanoate cleavage protein [Phyllobacterium sp. KW56]MBZ9603240.1 3-keto-5-aminohexanoate cleavage protein [Phyllobacterium sp. KW56]
MEKLIITAAYDSRVSYPGNPNCIPSTRENVPLIAEEYVRCLNAGAAIAHLHGVRKLEDKIQADGRKLSRLDVDGWREMTDAIKGKADCIIQYGIAGARLEDRIPLMELKPDMMAVAFNAHDEYFQPDKSYPPNAIYALHPLDELRDYARVTKEHGVKMELESFHTGALWNMRKLMEERLLDERIWTTLFIGWAGGSWTPCEERALIYMVDCLPKDVVWNVSCMDPDRAWNILALAISLGGHIRVGFEDNPYLKPGELSDSCARLVDKAVSMAHILGREVANPDEARGIIGLKAA